MRPATWPLRPSFAERSRSLSPPSMAVLVLSTRRSRASPSRSDRTASSSSPMAVVRASIEEAGSDVAGDRRVGSTAAAPSGPLPPFGPAGAVVAPSPPPSGPAGAAAAPSSPSPPPSGPGDGGGDGGRRFLGPEGPGFAASSPSFPLSFSGAFLPGPRFPAGPALFFPGDGGTSPSAFLLRPGPDGGGFAALAAFTDLRPGGDLEWYPAAVFAGGGPRPGAFF
mmetsp:Transcript_36605/g.87351  ORF Transcript_36605/g.87351 Transcript_36605/m.87351 type:complete len:223 (+) Transcript_36605:218-886(+)